MSANPVPFFVAGIADKVLGQKVVLIVEARAKKLGLDLSDIKRIERPKETYFTPQFHRTKSGKIQRQKTLDSLDLNHT